MIQIMSIHEKAIDVFAPTLEDRSIVVGNSKFGWVYSQQRQQKGLKQESAPEFINRILARLRCAPACVLMAVVYFYRLEQAQARSLLWVPALQLHRVSAQGAVHHAWTVQKTSPIETEEAPCTGHAGMPTDARPGQHMPRGRTAHRCRKPSCCRTPDYGRSRCCHGPSLRGRRSRRRATHRASTATWSPSALAHPPGGPAPRTGSPGASPAHREARLSKEVWTEGMVCVCVFITAGPSTKLFAWVGGGYGRTCATRDDEPRPVWTRLLITH
jgi:hypothetical protein